MRHLTAGVDARVGAAGHRQRGPVTQGQQATERFLDGLLDSAQARLAGPAVKGGAVVGQVQAEPDGRLVGRLVAAG